MSEKVVPLLEEAKRIVEKASKIDGLSRSTISTLKSYVEELGCTIYDLTGEWANINPQYKEPLPTSNKKIEIKVLDLVYHQFKDREFSEKDVGDFLWKLAGNGAITGNAASRYGHTRRLYRQGLVSSRNVSGKYEYKFNEEGRSFIEEMNIG